MAIKNLYIIAGCNGAGKTTASFTILPRILNCEEFVNADEIAHGLSPFHPETVAVEAGRLMLKRIDELLNNEVSFSIETTLATKSYASLVKNAHRKGYKVNLLFFWIDSPEMAVERVAKRVREGGHNIPTDVILRRYTAGIKNFFNIYKDIVDYWILVDNATNPRQIIAEQDFGSINIFDKIKYKKIQDYANS